MPHSLPYFLDSPRRAGLTLNPARNTYFQPDQRALIEPLTSPRSAIVGSPVVGSFAIPWQIAFEFTPQGQLFMLLLLIMMLIVALMLSSKNPALRQRGSFWEKEVENLESTAV